jgi:hypothetical protein
MAHVRHFGYRSGTSLRTENRKVYALQRPAGAIRLRTGTKMHRDFSGTRSEGGAPDFAQNTEVLSRPPIPLPQKRQARQVAGFKGFLGRVYGFSWGVCGS